MAHMVICQICNLKFDRDVIQAVKGTSANRYAHFSCNPKGELVPMVKPPSKATRLINNDAIKVTKATDKIRVADTPIETKQMIAVKDFINEVCGYPKDAKFWAMIQRQLNDLAHKGCTYPGILATLLYMYKIKDFSFSIIKDAGIANVYNYYQEAKEYYTELDYLKKTNMTKDVLAVVNQIERIGYKKPSTRNTFREFKI